MIYAFSPSGPDTNGAQFCILTNHGYNTTWLDYHVTVFGVVLEHMNTARKIDTVPTNKYDQPLEDCVITDTQAIKLTETFMIKRRPVPYTKVRVFMSMLFVYDFFKMYYMT